MSHAMDLLNSNHLRRQKISCLSLVTIVPNKLKVEQHFRWAMMVQQFYEANCAHVLGHFIYSAQHINLASFWLKSLGLELGKP